MLWSLRKSCPGEQALCEEAGMLADAAPPSLVRKQAAKLLHNICVQLVKSGHIDVPFAKGDDECEVPSVAPFA